jgi:urease beta subunit
MNRWPIMRESLVGEEQATADMVDKQCQIGSHFSFLMVDSASDQHWLSIHASM